MQLHSLGREDLPEEQMATHSGILAGKPHGQMSLASTQVLLMLFNDYISFSALLFLLPGVNLCFIRVTFLIYLP